MSAMLPTGSDARPFEAQLVDGKWYMNDIIADDSDETITQLHENGMSIRDIAERLGMSKSAVDRKLKRVAI
jgi:predicted DNA binding protein